MHILSLTELLFVDCEEQLNEVDSYVSSPHSSVETDPNWWRTIETYDEEFEAMSDLGLDLPDDDLFLESHDEDWHGEDDATFYDAKGPFSRVCYNYLSD